MRYFAIFLLLVCFPLLCRSQNASYALFEDSILPLAITNYAKSKEIYRQNKRHSTYDPSDVILYLTYSLENDDVKFFKSNILLLFKNHGYSYSYSDTTGASMVHTLNQEIVDHNLSDWMVKKSNTFYPKWISKHTDYVQLKGVLEHVHATDQLIRHISIKPADSTCFSDWKTVYDSTLAAIDLKNIILIQNICIQNGYRMPNNFENGHTTFNQIMFIVFHNFKQGTNIDETWQRLGPYMEKAYLEGKISDTFFQVYDYYLNLYQGVQYYGTLSDDVPNKDPNGFSERQKKFNL